MRLPETFTNLQPIRINQRYRTFRAEYRGKQVFIKQSSNDSAVLRRGIWRELWGLETFGSLAQSADLGFAVPKIITSGEDYVVTSWAKGKTMAFDPTGMQFEEQVDFFARAFAAIDRYTQLVNPLPGTFSARYRDPRGGITQLQSLVASVPYASFLDPALVEAGFGYVFEHVAHLEARLTHPDFTPNNVIDDKGIRTLVDYESCGLLWPRFYDIANMTVNRIATVPELAPGCRQLIERYLRYNSSVPEAVWLRQCNTVAAVRCLSMIWELLTRPNARHNTSLQLTATTAARLSALLQTILAGRPYYTADIF